MAQITITSADLPVIGLSYVTATDTNFTAAITAGGANQTWNYTSLQNHSQDTTSFIDAAGTQAASFFPTANLATFDVSAGSYTYFISNTTGFYINGATTGGALGGLLEFDPPMTFIHTPFTYNNTYTDYARVQVDSGSGFGAIRFIHHVQNSLTADGWGVLQLPTGNYNNTLRVKCVELSTDSILLDLFGTGNYVMFGAPTVSQITHYRWFANGSASFLLNIDADSAGTTATNADYLVNYSVGLYQHNRSAFSMQVSPNPASDKVHLVFPQTIQSALLKITDAQGKLSDEIAVSQNDLWLDVNKYKEGWYFLSINNNGQLLNAKMLIQRGK